MSALGYRPLFAGVFVLQSLAALTVSLSRFPTLGAALLVTGVCSAGFAAALASAYRLSRRSYVPGNAAQLAQLGAVGIAMFLWVTTVGPIGMFVAFGIVLLIARDATLTTRRALYFDLGILLTLFYDAVGARELPYRWPLAIAFLLVLLFVLMADYTDRRLAHLRLGESRALKDVIPGLRNAGFATALVLALAGLIYLLMPQPKALEVSLTPDRGPPNWLLGLLTADAGPDGPSNALEGDKGNGEKGNESSGDGAGEKGKGSSGKGSSGDGDTGSGGGNGNGNGNGNGKGKGPGGSGLESGNASGDDGNGNQHGWVTELGTMAKGAANMQMSRKNYDCDGPAVAPPSPEPLPIALFVMRSDRPLQLRAHAYALPGAECWGELPLQRIEGQGGVISRKGAPADGVTQVIRVVRDLDDRFPSAYMFTMIGAPDGADFKINLDWSVSAGHPIKSGARYLAKSTVHYLGERPSGPAETAPPSFYTALPLGGVVRVGELARRIVGSRSVPSEKAIALEQYLRANYKPMPFKARKDVDSTDEFLFRTHGGRSRHFAVALATMLRSIGIPSRVISGYRARRYNPLREEYEVWESDKHHWVEAYIETGWVAFEPAPWATPPAKGKPENDFAAAREYVRLAREPAVDIELAGEAAPRVKESYLRYMLVWAWFATYGKLMLLACLALTAAAWRWRWWLLPLRDALDRLWLRRAGKGDPAQVVKRCYEAVERMCTRRKLTRGHTENHAEYLRRVGRMHPHLLTQCSVLAALFGAARYGRAIGAQDALDAVHASRVIAELIDEKAA